MPRNGANIYSKPAGTTAVSNTTIESAKYNSVVDDLVTDANTPRPVVAGGTGASSAAGALTALGAQPLDAGLTSISGLTTAANKMIYTTASDAYAVADLTAAGRALLDDADAAAQRTTLGLGTVAVESTVPMSKGGTGAALVDPNADRILFWDDSAGAIGFLTPSTGLAISGTDLTAPGPDLYFRLNSANAGANGTSAQNIFPQSVTLEASTVYEYQIFCSFSRTAGSTGHDFSTLFGGTATLNNIYRDIIAQGINTAATTAASVSYFGYRLSAAAQVIVAGLGATTSNVWMTERGTVSINGAGTFIPQYQLSAAPGGAYSTNAGSFFRLRKLGASGADNSQGTWA